MNRFEYIPDICSIATTSNIHVIRTSLFSLDIVVVCLSQVSITFTLLLLISGLIYTRGQFRGGGNPSNTGEQTWHFFGFFVLSFTSLIPYLHNVRVRSWWLMKIFQHCLMDSKYHARCWFLDTDNWVWYPIYKQESVKEQRVPHCCYE